MSGPNFTATLDFSQVDRGLEQTAKRSEGTVLSYGKLEGSMKRLEAQSVKMSGYLQEKFIPQFARLDDGLTKSTKGFWALEGGAKAFQQRLAPQAAAISNISAQLGENAGQAGKAVAAVGQLAAAYAAGGPLGVALAAAGAAVTLLIQHWEKLIEKENEALAKKYSATDVASTILQKARKDVEDLQQKLSEQDLNAREKALSAANREIRAVQDKIDAMRVEGKIWTANEIAAKNMLETTLKVLYAKQRLAGRVADLETPAKASGPDKILGGHDVAGSDSFQNQLNAMQARADAEGLALLALDEQYARDMADQARHLAAESAQVDSEIVQQRQARFDIESELTQAALAEQLAALAQVERAYESLYMDAIPGALGNATAFVADFAIGVSTNQKYAFETAAAAFLQSQGQQLVGLGTKAIWEGAIISANPLTPGAGLPMIGIGIGAVAAGAVMAGGGAALGASIPSGGSTSRGATERGVGSGFSGGGRSSGDSGGLVVNITYSAAGPAPEQTGREVERVLLTLGSRRGMTPSRQGPVVR